LTTAAHPAEGALPEVTQPGQKVTESFPKEGDRRSLSVVPGAALGGDLAGEDPSLWAVPEGEQQGAVDAVEKAPAPRLRFERIQVGGVRTDHCSGGSGIPVVFLHGWGIGPHSYSAALNSLLHLGCKVLAPAMPGFGGTAALAGSRCSFEGYSSWLREYLDAAGVRERAVVVGHSFGGGVAVQAAHDLPDRVRAVVSCNGVGGMGGSVPADRPWWEWGRYLGSDLLALDSFARVLPAVFGQALPNLVQNPIAMWRVGEFVRRADLRREVLVLKSRGVPVTIVWSDRDRLVTHASFTEMCRASGTVGVVVPGNHSWLIADPRRFTDVMLKAFADAGLVEESLFQRSA
jgi:pimeloyl-ACP methyl ester carboxylesterase